MLFVFIMLSLAFSVPSQEIGCKECLRSDLFFVAWDARP